MLAPLVMPSIEQPHQERTYSGFPWWYGLLVPPMREERTAQWLMRLRVFPYLPTFTKQVRRRGHMHRARLYPALPGLMFAPIDVLDIPNRKEVFDRAGVRGFIRTSNGHTRRISKSEIEEVRLLEAKLNLPPEAKGVFFKVGQQVRFKDGSLWQSWIGGTIFEIVDETRIGILVPKLFGCPRKAYFPASEIEAM